MCRSLTALSAIPFTVMLLAVPAHARDEDQPVKIASAQAVRGTQSVVIGAFNVGFIFESVDSGKAQGGMIGAFGGVSRAKSVLVGVTPQMMQAITDAAYADFRAQLEAKGFTVADSAALYASPAFARVKPEAAPFQASVVLEKKSSGKASYYKPSALPGIVMLPGDFESTGFSGMGMTMRSGNTQYGMAEHAKASGQAVIDVVYLIDFSNVKRPGAFSLGSIKVSTGVSVVDDRSRMSIVTTGGKVASFTLNTPVAVEGDLATMADTTKDKTLQTAGNVLGGLAAVGGLGGLKFGKSRTYTFTATPGRYEEGAIKAATLSNTRLIESLAAIR